MDTLLLEYRLNTHGISRTALLEIMGWSEPTRQTRVLRGYGWRLEELQALVSAGFSFEELQSIFFTPSDHKSGQHDGEV